jgi:hypothetical protein
VRKRRGHDANVNVSPVAVDIVLTVAARALLERVDAVLRPSVAA